MAQDPGPHVVHQGMIPAALIVPRMKRPGDIQLHGLPGSIDDLHS